MEQVRLCAVRPMENDNKSENEFHPNIANYNESGVQLLPDPDGGGGGGVVLPSPSACATT